MATFKKGQMVRITAEFRDSTSTLVDPTAVTYSVVADSTGATVVASSAATKDSTGKYHADVDTTNFNSGSSYWYQIKGTGTNQGVDEGSIVLDTSKFG